MAGAEILMLNFDPRGVLGDVLRAILESSSRLTLSLRQVLVEDYEGLSLNDSPLSKVYSFNPDLVFIVFAKEQLNAATILSRLLRKNFSRVPIIVVDQGRPSEGILALLNCGISDYIIPPLKDENILPRVWRLLEKSSRRAALSQQLKEKIELSHLIGESRPFVQLKNRMVRAAKCDSGILILGETGSGKELFARAIHYLSRRSDHPFIPINCGALPLDLVENELFGHERGAYTSASNSSFGLVHEAEAGTLFLDEIDCLPAKAQVSLLRFLQNGEYRPVGSSKNCRADVRIIAATNVNVEKAVSEGRFRQDLYYRLNVIPLVLPPLRERQEDILLLARHFLKKYTAQLDKKIYDFSLDAMQELMCYPWPGNVRELEHVIERAIIFSDQEIIKATDLSMPSSAPRLEHESFREAKGKVIEQFEKNYLQRVLITNQGNITKAAAAAKKNRRAFWQLIRKHHLDVESYRAGRSEFRMKVAPDAIMSKSHHH
jgi:DNA-binding NtrC family response regulator